MDTPQTTPTQGNSPATENQENATPISLEARLQAMESELQSAKARIQELNHEAAQKRIRATEAEKRAEQERQQRLAEQGEYKTLFEQTRAQLDELQAYRDRYEAVTNMITATNEKRIAAIPEALRGLVPTGYTPENLAAWLDANQAVLRMPTPPSLDAGARSNAKPAVTLTPEELRIAQLTGMTPEEYAKYKKE